MNPHQPVPEMKSPAAHARQSIEGAKTRLLAWADETDGRAQQARNNFGVLAAGGVLAAVGCVVIYRVLTPRRRLVASGPRSTSVTTSLMSWAMVLRAGLWLLPHAAKAVRGYQKHRAMNSPALDQA